VGPHDEDGLVERQWVQELLQGQPLHWAGQHQVVAGLTIYRAASAWHRSSRNLISGARVSSNSPQTA
jgi:hypothetical protein